MHIIIQLLLALTAWKWGDWKHWKKYYHTILFLIIGDLLNNFINYNYSLWTFRPTHFEESIFRNHTIISLGVYFIGYPSIVLLYLGNYPKAPKSKQFVYVAAWVVTLSLLESISHYWVKGIVYSHGWTYWWSVLFFIFLLVNLRIHYLRPFIAWAISIVVIIMWILFGVPIQTMK